MMFGPDWSSQFARAESARKLEIALMAENKKWGDAVRERLDAPTPTEPQIAYELTDRDRLFLIHNGIQVDE